MANKVLISIFIFCIFLGVSKAAKAPDPKECEVCKKVLEDIDNTLTDDDRKDIEKIETKIGKYCSNSKADPQTKKICYHIDPIKREVSRPLSFKMPVEDICRKKLNKKNSEFCSTRFPVKVEKGQDLSKLRIKDLKKILADRGVACNGCLEKSDYIKKIEETEL